ncbi:MAG: hypothetical protein QNJ98_17235 [Planctomycetota bacterium]|nr:hypothetical protein [Planctomycetota bacterium]
MGVAIQSKKRAHAAPMPPPPPAATPVVAQQPVEPAPVAKAPTSLVRTINTTVKDAERTLRSLRGKKRDASFTRMQTDAMASLSKAREELGAWLDEHPNDKRANTLWDRLQRVYIALKKL